MLTAQGVAVRPCFDFWRHVANNCGRRYCKAPQLAQSTFGATPPRSRFSMNLKAAIIGWSSLLLAGLLTAGSSFAGPPTTSLVAYYSFDATTTDLSGNGHDGVAQGTSFAAGHKNSGLNVLSGTTYVEVPSSNLIAPTTAVTVSFWMKPRSYPSAYTCAIYKPGAVPTFVGNQDRSYTVWLRSDGGIHLTSTAQGASAQTYCDSTAGVIQLNKFNHVVCVVDTATHLMRIICNGVAVGSAAYPGASIRSGNYPLRIGGPFITNTDQSGVDGIIDEVRIYNRALREEELSRLFIYLDVSATQVGLTLTFDGVLQHSDHLQLWSDVTGATSPYLHPFSLSESKFFRVRAP